MIVDVLRGRSSEKVRQNEFDKLSTFGLMEKSSDWDVRRVLDALLVQGYLRATEDQYRLLKLTPAAREILTGGKKFEMRVPVTPEKATGKSGGEPDMELFARLKKLRMKLAAKASVPPYFIFTDATLREMCAEKPENAQQLLQVSGVGEKKAEKYGKAFLDEIRAYIEEA